MSKRLFDIFGSLLGLVLLLPVFLVIAIAIKLESSGPVFFRQIRIGKDEVPFRIHKFRTMRVEQMTSASKVTALGDPRITPLGAKLRRYKIDELPQLIDVLNGAMSLVGPRPEVPIFVKAYPDHIRARVFSVKPGITERSSAEFIDEERLLASSDDPHSYYITNILPRKLALNLEYVDNVSLINDLKIICATLLILFKRSSN
ncbi:sugar transferase [Porphyrobacter algicida]|uniref:Sugar transferase n=1 Tax=Qipengyuania algicida TaxID=1836209 RepID=A0A845AFG9_9SPHN|nr:sugar transferase [Qipengyuania algicida]MXP27973.1 sugar transferase [Qipengyuania algicida]